MKRINVYLPDAAYEALRKESFEKKTSMSTIIANCFAQPLYVVKNGEIEGIVDTLINKPGQVVLVDNVKKLISKPPKLPKSKGTQNNQLTKLDMTFEL